MPNWKNLWWQSVALNSSRLEVRKKWTEQGIYTRKIVSPHKATNAYLMSLCKMTPSISKLEDTVLHVCTFFCYTWIIIYLWNIQYSVCMAKSRTDVSYREKISLSSIFFNNNSIQFETESILRKEGGIRSVSITTPATNVCLRRPSRQLLRIVSLSLPWKLSSARLLWDV